MIFNYAACVNSKNACLKFSDRHFVSIIDLKINQCMPNTLSTE